MSRRQGREVLHVVRDFLVGWNAATAEQRQVLLALAAFAPAIRPGYEQLRALLGIHKNKIRPAIAYWLALKVLVLETPGRPRHAAEYHIDLHQMAALLGTPVEPSQDVFFRSKMANKPEAPTSRQGRRRARRARSRPKESPAARSNRPAWRKGTI
jgi:hypothetical protein